MILQELARYAERDGLLGPSSNFETVAVSWAIQLGADGRFEELRDLRQPVERGKKKMLLGQPRSVPLMNGKRTIKVLARFLVDNAKYVLAATEEEAGAEKALLCQKAFVDLLQQAALTTGSPMLQPVLAFLAAPTEIERARKALINDKAASNDLVTFYLSSEDCFLDNVLELRDWWDGQMSPAEQALNAQCLVCGRERAIIRLHSNIKGLRNASASGVPMVSFNKSAFESYGWSQGANAPICQSCDRAYVTAVNRLLSDRFVRPTEPEIPLAPQSLYLGASITALYWTDSESTQIARAVFDPGANPDDVKRLLESPRHAKRTAIDGRFHCLLLQGAEGRATVKSYHFDTVERVETNVRLWLEQTNTINIKDPPVPMRHPQWLMLKELTPSGKDDKLPKAWPVGLYLSSLFNLPIPPAIAQAAIVRNRMEAKVSDTRAALLQAWLARTPLWQERKTLVSLDLECNEPAYRLGRALAICDRIQYFAAERRVGRSFSDSFFSPLSTRPHSVLGRLLDFTRRRASQLKRGEASAFIRLGEVLPSPTELPERMSLKQQALFGLGFYHQRAEDMKKKEDSTDDHSAE